MAVVQKPPSQTRQWILIGLLGIIALVAVWYFFFSGNSGSSTSSEAISLSPVATAGEMVNPNVPKDLFTDPRFTELKVYATVPVAAGSVGRENPFAKISAAPAPSESVAAPSQP